MTATLSGRVAAAVAGVALFLAAGAATAAPHLGVKARAFPGGGVKVTEVGTLGEAYVAATGRPLREVGR